MKQHLVRTRVMTPEARHLASTEALQVSIMATTASSFTKSPTFTESSHTSPSSAGTDIPPAVRNSVSMRQIRRQKLEQRLLTA